MILPNLHNVWTSQRPEGDTSLSFVEFLGHHPETGRWSYLLVAHLAATGYVTHPIAV